MKITSDDSLFLDEVFTELKKERVKVEKETEEVKGAMGIITTAIEILTNLDINDTVEHIETIINLIVFWKNSRRINYLHYKIKDGAEVKLNNLTDDQLQEFVETLRKNFNQLEYIHTGKK